jgi:hypothetical protein
VYTGLLAQEPEVLLEASVVLTALNQPADLLIEGLDADLELERSRWKLCNHLAQTLRQPIRDHFEMEEMPGLIVVEEKLENRPADTQV